MDYFKIYNQLIDKATSEDRERNKDIYYEGHHIIPRCMGGKGSAKNSNHPNIILLTAKEHYMAHRLLCEIYPNNKRLQYAMCMMINNNQKGNRYIPSGRIFSVIKETNARLPVTIETRKKISDAAKNRKPMSDETKLKLSNRIISDETRKKISESKKNVSVETRKKLSDRIITNETRKKISESMKGRIAWNKGISKDMWSKR